jgi:uncharacterized heparinase superfamily protein
VLVLHREEGKLDARGVEGQDIFSTCDQGMYHDILRNLSRWIWHLRDIVQTQEQTSGRIQRIYIVCPMHESKVCQTKMITE